LIWHRAFGGCGDRYPRTIAFNSVGDVIVSGITQDRGTSINGFHPNAYQTVRYDASDGHVIWQDILAPPGLGDEVRAMAVGGDNKVIVTGTSRNSDDNFDFRTVRYEPSGGSMIIIHCPANIVAVDGSGQCSAVVSFLVTAADECGNSVPVTSSPPSGSSFPVGTTTVTSSTADGAQCSFTVTVVDIQRPTIRCSTNLTVNAPCGQASMMVSYPAPTASDHCSDVTVTCTPPSGSEFPVGVTRVSCVARDAADNSSVCRFLITVTTLPFDFIGFLPPLAGADATGGTFGSPLRTFKLNSTIPVKFTARCGGSLVVSDVHTLQAIKYSDQTTADSPIDATPTDAATTGNQFRLTGDEWHFNLDTKATGMSAGIWLLRATLSDGTQHSVWIQIK
jgi:hypothetical protein